MSNEKPDDEKQSSEISPWIFPVLLAAFGLWCFYDGWLTSNPKMEDYRLFNRITSGILLPWAAYDFLKVRRYTRKNKEEQEEDKNPNTVTGEQNSESIQE